MTDNPGITIYEQHYNNVCHGMHLLTRRLPLTVGEILFFSSFIANFIAGKVVHMVSPAEEVYNYYNNKHNILNQWFVKRGWGWTTVYVIVFYVVQAYSNQKKGKKQLTVSQLVGAAGRWAAVTLWWWLFTQWCFGAPIMDKIFVFTGGQCTVEPEINTLGLGSSLRTLFTPVGETGLLYSNKVTSLQCRRLRGSWEGGHDPSGHAFLLVHASLYLFLEGKDAWLGWEALYENFQQFRTQWKASQTTSDAIRLIPSFVLHNPHVILFQLFSLWWFMLLMTNIYFHSVFEKFVGLLFGYVGIIVIYIVPRLFGAPIKLD